MDDIDPRCIYTIRVLESSAQEVFKALDPETLTKLGCRVLKHPDCCVLCAANNDCTRVPLHFRCRCKIEGFLEIGV